MTYCPRPYQIECIDALHDHREAGLTRMLYVLPTGCGKTPTFAWLAGDLLGEGLSPGLIIAHRDMLLTQAQKKLLQILELSAWEIGIEQGPFHAPHSAKIILASIQTIMNPARLGEWRPAWVIVDETHRINAPSYIQTLNRLGCFGGGTLLFGCTATAKRGDKKAIYARKPDNTPVLTSKDAGGLQHCPFEKLVYEYPILQAIEDAWLVPLLSFRVKTTTDLTKVGMSGEDFNASQLQAVLAEEQKTQRRDSRTELAIDKWEEVAKDRQTIVFTAGVEMAHTAAERWRRRGYRFEALDGTTDTQERRAILHRFETGETQGICNDAVLGEGFDAWQCAAIVCLKPTKSWTICVQQIGRGLRPQEGCVDAFETPEARADAIQRSGKQDCIVIDVVDMTAGKKLCTAGALADLPPDIDLQGKSLLEVVQLMRKYEERRGRIEVEIPANYEELQGILERVDLLGSSEATSAGAWRANEHGYSYTRLTPGRTARLLRAKNGAWELHLSGDGVINPVRSCYARTPKALFDFAEKQIEAAWPKKAKALRSKYAWSDKQLYWLRKAGFTTEGIVNLTRGQGSAIIGKVRAQRQGGDNMQDAA